MLNTPATVIPPFMPLAFFLDFIDGVHQYLQLLQIFIHFICFQNLLSLKNLRMFLHPTLRYTQLHKPILPFGDYEAY